MTMKPIHGNDLADGYYSVVLSQGGEVVGAEVTIGDAAPLEPPVLTATVEPELAAINEPQPYADALSATYLSTDNWTAERPGGGIVAVEDIYWRAIVDGEAADNIASASAEGEVVGAWLYFDLAEGEDTQIVVVDGTITVGAAANLPPTISNPTPSDIGITFPEA